MGEFWQFIRGVLENYQPLMGAFYLDIGIRFYKGFSGRIKLSTAPKQQI